MATTRDAVATEHGRSLIVGSRCVRSAVLALVVVVGTAACTGTDPVTAPTGTPIAPASATTAAPGTTQPRWSVAQQEVVDAYMAADEAETTASSNSDPDDASLAASHGDPLLAKLRSTYMMRRQQGQRTRFPEDSKYRVVFESVSSTPTVAELVNCTVDDAIVYVPDSGAVINDELIASRLVATFTRRNGKWILSDRKIANSWKGATECAS